MIRHYKLIDPIERTREMTLDEFVKYIDIRDEQLRDGTITDPALIDKIHGIFFKTHPKISKKHLNEIWDFVRPMIEENAALAQFILDYDGAISNYFFPWLMTVATSPSAALEMAYGTGLSVGGKWSPWATVDQDAIEDFVRNVPTLVYNRERQLFMADLVSSIKDNGKSWHPTKVVDLGAGRMAWARWHKFIFDDDVQKIIAVDKDPGIDPAALFAPRSLKNLGIEYVKSDIHTWLRETKEKDIDLVMLGGVASYYPQDIFVETIMRPVYKLLKTGGAFFFDLQLECPQYEWTTKLFNWPEMKLASSATEAIGQVERIRRDLWRSGIRFSAEYTVDTCNEYPSAVMVVFGKI